MAKWIKRILLLVILAVFLFSVGTLALKAWQDYQSRQNYQTAAGQFTADTAADDTAPDKAPFAVDFDALHAVNPDVVGWIRCEGTVIDYPVLRGATNDTYLRTLYDGTYSMAGSIFVETANAGDFSDYNTIVYGHNMNDGSMFGSLASWQEQSFYDEHRWMWLLTPTQAYRIDLLGGYYTDAFSATYTIFNESGQPLDDYLAACLAQSAFVAEAKPEAGARYVLLSTCADSELVNEARFVLHGKLVPVAPAD